MEGCSFVNFGDKEGRVDLLVMDRPDTGKNRANSESLGAIFSFILSYIHTMYCKKYCTSLNHF